MMNKSSGSPFMKLGVVDWFQKLKNFQEQYNSIQNEAFVIRQAGREARDHAAVETEWSIRKNNDLLKDRTEELKQWKDTLSNYHNSVANEIQLMKNEKSLSEKEIELLSQNFDLVNQCLTLRDERKEANLCTDDVENELNKELNMLEIVKKELTDKCDEAWQQIILLTKMKNELEINIIQKEETINIEQDTISLSKNTSAFVSHKPIINTTRRSIAYESWLEDCRDITQRAETELNNSYKLRNEMCVPRNRKHNEILSQKEFTNFAFRKRIFEFQNALSELQWQKENFRKQSEHLLDEINKLEQSLNKENGCLKLAESQNGNRIYRPEQEFCQDICTVSLEEQIFDLQNIMMNLINKLSGTKNMYTRVQEQIQVIESEITNKNSALNVDLHCLDIRQSTLY